MPDSLVTGGNSASVTKVTNGELQGDYFAGKRDYSGETPYKVDGDFVYYTAKTTDGAEFAVDVFTKKGDHVGSVEFAKRDGDVWQNPSLEVSEKYRRKGIATEMYRIAETESPDYVYRGTDESVGGVRTPDGQAFRKAYDSTPAKPSERQKFGTGEKVEPKVDEEAMLRRMADKYALDKAYGISHTNQFTSSSIIDENLEGLVGIENNNFLEARNLFDSDMAVTLPDGSTFSVNDLRSYDMADILPAYDRRVDGDVAIMGGSGKTTKELKDEIMALDKQSEGNGSLKGEVEALKDTMKILTGRARMNPEGAFGTILRSITDLAFFAKNFYMPLQNFTEVAAMLSKGNTSAVLHGIPLLNDWVSRRKPMSGSEIKEIHGMVFGKELDQLMRPGREDHIRRLRESTDTNAVVANVVGTIRFGTQELAARSPWTMLLNGTSNYIIDAARQGVLGDVAGAALAGKGSKFGKANYLKSASVSPEQWKGIKQLLRDHATRDADGKFTIRDKQAFAYDPRTMDLWRLADKVAYETILMPHRVSSQDTKAYGAAVKMVMQFKNFVIKSLNARFVRLFYDATKNNRAIDSALTAIISMGLAGGYYVAQAHLKAYGLQEHKRKEYLKNALDPKMIAHASLSRSSHLGSPLSVYDMIGGLFGNDTYQYTRSTVLPKEKTERDRNKAWTGKEIVGNIVGAISNQVPAVGLVGNIGSTAMNASTLLSSDGKQSEVEFRTGVFNSMRELVPNDPLTQQLIMHIFEEQGIKIKDDATRPRQ